MYNVSRNLQLMVVMGFYESMLWYNGYNLGFRWIPYLGEIGSNPGRRSITSAMISQITVHITIRCDNADWDVSQ